MRGGGRAAGDNGGRGRLGNFAVRLTREVECESIACRSQVLAVQRGDGDFGGACGGVCSDVLGKVNGLSLILDGVSEVAGLGVSGGERAERVGVAIMR